MMTPIQSPSETAVCARARRSPRASAPRRWNQTAFSPASWTANHPEIRWLDDKQRFIWGSERTGFKNYYLYDISGKLLATLTNHPFEVAVR